LQYAIAAEFLAAESEPLPPKNSAAWTSLSQS